MPPKYEIRQATISQPDLEGIKQAHRASILEIGPTKYTPQQISAWGKDRPESGYGDAIYYGEVYFVAESIKEPGFFYGVSSYKLENAQHCLKMLYVRGAYARHGIGKELYNTVEDYALEKGAGEIFIRSSLTGKEFYLAQGSEILRQYPYEFDGIGFECIDMKKALSV